MASPCSVQDLPEEVVQALIITAHQPTSTSAQSESQHDTGTKVAPCDSFEGSAQRVVADGHEQSQVLVICGPTYFPSAVEDCSSSGRLFCFHSGLGRHVQPYNKAWMIVQGVEPLSDASDVFAQSWRIQRDAGDKSGTITLQDISEALSSQTAPVELIVLTPYAGRARGQVNHLPAGSKVLCPWGANGMRPSAADCARFLDKITTDVLRQTEASELDDNFRKAVKADGPLDGSIKGQDTAMSHSTPSIPFSADDIFKKHCGAENGLPEAEVFTSNGALHGRRQS